MKTITRNAILQLFEKAEELSQEPHESWRCIYLSFSKSQRPRNPALHVNFVVRGICDLLAEQEGNIYLCDDGDIFILFQGAFRPVLGKLANHFGDIDPTQLQDPSQDSLFSVFDLIKDWKIFFGLCETKYLGTLVTQEELHKQHFYRSSTHAYAKFPQA